MAKKIKTRDGLVIYGKTTSGITKKTNGNLLFKVRFNDNNGAVVDKRQLIKADEACNLTTGELKQHWQEWAEETKSLYGRSTFKLAKVVADEEEGKHRADLTFKQLSMPHGKWFTDYATKHYSDPYREINKLNILNNDEQFSWYVNKDINLITEMDCNRLMTQLRGLKNTVNMLARYKSSVSSVFEYAMIAGYREGNTNPNSHVRLEIVPKRKKTHKVNVFNSSELRMIQEYIDDTDSLSLIFKTFYTTAIQTAMRRGEIAALTWEDIDFKNNIIYVRKSVRERSKAKGGTIIANTTKGGEDRVVPMSFKLKDYFKALKDLNENNKAKSWVDGEGVKFNLVFLRHENKPYTLTHYSRVWTELNKDMVSLGVVNKVLNVHKLRGSAISFLLNETSLGTVTAQKIAGHSSFQTTENYYVNVDNAKISEISQLIVI